MSLRHPEHTKDYFLSKIPQVPPVALEGIYYRLILATRAQAIAETGGSFLFGGRYNVRNGFGGLYLSESSLLAWQEILRYYQGRIEFIPDHVQAAFHISLQKILDAASPTVQKILSIELEDLIDPMDYGTTQALAQAARQLGIEGIRYPSCPNPKENNMVIYVDQILSGSSVFHEPPVPFHPPIS